MGPGDQAYRCEPMRASIGAAPPDRYAGPLSALQRSTR
jgi:hypothetical protein